MVILKRRSICSVRLLEDGLSKTPPNKHDKHKGWTNAGLTLGQRRRQWANVSPAVGQRLVFAGHNITHTPATYVIMLIGEMAGELIHSHYRCDEHRTHTQAYIIGYVSLCWGFKQFSKCDNVQNRAIRFFLGVYGFNPIPFLYSEMLWQSTRYRQWINTIRYWNRLILQFSRYHPY